MSDVFFEEMQIPKPDYSLGINSMTHGEMTGTMMIKLEGLLQREKPDVVLVYGDTNSTLAAALAAAKIHIPVAHVEAGLRSFNKRMPEELNRIATDHFSDHLFCPTTTAVENLHRENVCKGVVLTGDVMLDAAQFYGGQSQGLDAKKFGNGKFILATFHREENTSNPERLGQIVAALNRIHTEIYPIRVPLHPGTRKRLAIIGETVNFDVMPPVSYLEMVELLKNCEFVITDSGGLQKEAYFFGKLCLTMRDDTEWIELVDGGFNKLVGADQQTIIQAAESITHETFSAKSGLYGNGDAGMKIAEILLTGGQGK